MSYTGRCGSGVRPGRIRLTVAVSSSAYSSACLVPPGNPNGHQATTDEQGCGTNAQNRRIEGDTTALREVLLLLFLFLLLFLLFLLLLFLFLLLLRKGGSGGHHHRRQE